MGKIVYAMTTTSGTFIADGINHHNCNCYRNGNYQVYEPKIKRELGLDEVQKLWDKAYSTQKLTQLELEDMLKDIKKKYKDMVLDRQAKGWKF